MRAPAFILSLSWLILTGCASSKPPEASLITTTPTTEMKAAASDAVTPCTYLFQVAEGIPTPTAQNRLNELLLTYTHAPATLTGKNYLRVVFSKDPGLSALQAAIKGQTTLIAVLPEYRYGTYPPQKSLR